MSEQRHLGRHIVAFDGAFQFFDDGHHGDHHQTDDGQHAAEQEHGGNGRRYPLFISAKGSVHELTSTR